MTNAELGERIGIGEEQVTSIARELTAAQLIRRERGGVRGTGRGRWVLLPTALVAAYAIGSAEPPRANAAHLQTDQAAIPLSGYKGRRRRRCPASGSIAAA